MSGSALAIALLILPILYASGTGPLWFANPVPTARDSVGSTQLVELIDSGGLLIGKPHASCVTSIVVLAPGISAARLVLRERQLNVAQTLIQIVAPTSLNRKLEHVTLFVSPEQEPIRLFQKEAGAWSERGLQRFVVSDGPTHAAIGIVLKDVGLLCLVRSPMKAGSLRMPAPPLEFGGFDPDVRRMRVLWHIVWPTITLAIFVLASKLTYSRYVSSAK